MQTHFSPGQLGWRTHFSTQLSLDELATTLPARVASVHRDVLTILAEDGARSVHLPRSIGNQLSSTIAVGDWVLIERTAPRVLRVLERQTALARHAAGLETRVQLIAANVDTLFIVTSCNDDFNLSRLERYLALAFEARVFPVIVLTKADLCSRVDELIDQVRSIARDVSCIAVNATDATAAALLAPWVCPGQTVAFVGSSGVGKSTLINRLLGRDLQLTSGVREHDSKGRHTTTARELLFMPSGAWLIDTPGMRELKVGTAQQGIRAAFDDVETLATQCRFRDCRHLREVGCAVRAAIASGVLDPRRLDNYLKLQRESERAGRTHAEQREIERRWGRMFHSAEKVRNKGRGE